MTLDDFRGEVKPCTCDKTSELACTMCRGRFFVAKCLSCLGKGQIEENVAGGPGTLKSTCNICGGTGTLPATQALFEAQEAKAALAQ